MPLLWFSEKIFYKIWWSRSEFFYPGSLKRGNTIRWSGIFKKFYYQIDDIEQDLKKIVLRFFQLLIDYNKDEWTIEDQNSGNDNGTNNSESGDSVDSASHEAKRRKIEENLVASDKIKDTILTQMHEETLKFLAGCVCLQLQVTIVVV